MFSELQVAPTFDQPRGSKAPPAGKQTSNGHAAQAGRAAAELDSPGYFLFSSSDSALRCASAPPMRMKFCTARQTLLYRECWQCTDHLEQLHESFDNADQSTHNGQHCAEVQRDGYAHVGGCAPLTCLQRTESAVSPHTLPAVSSASCATAYAGMPSNGMASHCRGLVQERWRHPLPA